MMGVVDAYSLLIGSNQTESHPVPASVSVPDLKDPSRFHAIKQQLLNQINLEESLYFTWLQTILNIDVTAALDVMRKEHREIRSLLEDIEKNLLIPELADPMLKRLKTLWKVHQKKEEYLVYPVIPLIHDKQALALTYHLP